jgi:hypothetical protein
LGAVDEIIKLKMIFFSISPQNREQCGRKRKTVFEDDVFLQRQSNTDPHKTSSDLLQLQLQFRYMTQQTTIDKLGCSKEPTFD